MSVLMGSQAAPNERESNGYRWLWRGMIGAALAVTPLQGARAVTAQEQPYHPAPFVSSGLPATNLAGETAFVRSTHDAALEADRRGRVVMFPGMPAKQVMPGAQLAVRTAQEQPREAFTVSAAGVQGPNVATGVTSVVVTRQEQPWHPAPYAWSTQAYTTSVVLTAEVRRLITAQEQPQQPLPQLRPGVQGPNVASGITSAVVTRQEQPWHPAPYARSSQLYAAASVALSPETRRLITAQEQPQQPASVTLPGIFFSGGPGALGLLIDGSLQEQPPYQQPVVVSGRQGPNVANEVVDFVLVRPQDPQHPLPFVAAGRQGPNVANEVVDFVVTRQEQPGHPLPYLWPTQVYVPSVFLSPVSRGVVTSQEQPWHPAPQARAGVQGPNVANEVVDFVVIRQEQPWHPAPYTWPTQVYVPSVFLSPARRSVTTAQEQPGHPASQLRPGVQGPNVASEVVDFVVVPPQDPLQPPSLLRSGVQGPNVGAVVSRATIGQQELPWHPASRLLPGVPPFVVAAPLAPLIGRQQLPDHPASSLWAGTPPVVLVHAPERRWLVVAQEQPWHPTSLTVSGVPVAAVTTTVMTVPDNRNQLYSVLSAGIDTITGF